MSSQANTQHVPKNDFHTLPIDDKKSGDTSSVLAGNPGLKGGAVVTSQPGPAIVSDQLANLPVKSSDDLDQRAAALNNPKPSDP